MEPQMRVRTMLIPAASILSSIPNDPARSFTTQERQLMVLAVLDEITHVHFQTVPWDYSFNAPPNQGAAFNVIQQKLPHLSSQQISNVIRHLKVRLTPVLAQYALSDEVATKEEAARILKSNDPVPLIFDHGVKYDWWKKYLLVTWYRPVINWQEMSVLTYYHRVVQAFSDKHKAGQDVITGGLGMTKIGGFLSNKYEISVL